MTFADRIRERYPEGLTGIFAIGGTRTTYALAQNRHAPDPGHFLLKDYVDFGSDFYRKLFAAFFDLGGNNIIIPALSYQRLSGERGSEYAEQFAALLGMSMEGKWVDFYRQLEIDPYFVGIDTLLTLPEQNFAHKLGAQCAEFNRNWNYQVGRHKLIWEIAPIPLYSIWKAHEVMGSVAQVQLETDLSATTDLQTVHDLLYRYFARAVYGTDIPLPQFYLGTNRNGDLKLRAFLPVALLGGSPFRMFFTPYPSLFTTRETLQAILEDLAFGTPLSSKKIDYSGQFTPELAEREYQRILELSSDPHSTLGLIRQAQSDSDN